MHKKLAADLISLAHSILQMKDKEDVKALKEKAHQVYEKLSILEYVDEYINTTPQALETKEELLEIIEKSEITENIEAISDEFDEATKDVKNDIIGELEEEEIQMTDAAEDIADIIIDAIEEENEQHFIEQPFDELEQILEGTSEETSEDEIVGEKEEEEIQMEEVAEDIADDIIESIEENPIQEFIEQPFEELEELLGVNQVKNDVKDIGEKKTPTLEEELQDTVSVDTVLDLFENTPTKSTLNDQLQTTIQIDLNDRIAFVKNLFDGSQGDFNRVVSQLNTFKTFKEAKKFVNKMVKPDYDWNDKQEFETRFLEVIERKFK